MEGDLPGGFHHVPVLFEEALHYLAVGSGELFVDATLGGAGHTEAMLRAGGRVIGIDRDPEALENARDRLASYGDAVVLKRSNFSEMAALVAGEAPDGVDGVLMDLGVSSHQLDSAERGFSLRADGPLDMRMDPAEELTAAVIVNTWGEDELMCLFRELGEEKRARAVAREIVRRRAARPFGRTMELADCVASVVRKTGRTHPATRVFQALRMRVNRELESLEEALESIPALLRPGGRLVVISFHSLEDRIVKRFMQRLSKPEIDRPEWPEARPNPELALRLLTKRPVTAAAAELGDNPRARSAKLRAAERLDTL
jgi:16S rRNA (cytosine1402-N4)-methyltransferase